MLSKFMNGITIITQFLYTHFTEKEKGGKKGRRKSGKTGRVAHPAEKLITLLNTPSRATDRIGASMYKANIHPKCKFYFPVVPLYTAHLCINI